jgi:hypothetical protein
METDAPLFTKKNWREATQNDIKIVDIEVSSCKQSEPEMYNCNYRLC